MAVNENNLIWIDLEMTGLDPQLDQIIEIATVVTSAQLDILAQGPVVAIHQPDSILEAMDEWNRRPSNSCANMWSREGRRCAATASVRIAAFWLD